MSHTDVELSLGVATPVLTPAAATPTVTLAALIPTVTGRASAPMAVTTTAISEAS